MSLELNEKEVKILLQRMGFDYSDKTVLIPAYRSDILHEIDLVEDIAIAYGYDNFIP
ncbi:MAG: phenylalanine--tRNA ligase subunit beta, partial [Nitrospinae bacterium]|nr:phenylalanine--tRNA ligase subunit beta [Nitrospinota bacterium]